MTREEAIEFAKHAQTMTDLPDVKAFYALAEAALREREQKPVQWISEVVRKPDWKGKLRDYYQASSCPVCHHPDPGHGISNYCYNCGVPMKQKED